MILPRMVQTLISDIQICTCHPRCELPIGAISNLKFSPLYIIHFIYTCICLLTSNPNWLGLNEPSRLAIGIKGSLLSTMFFVNSGPHGKYRTDARAPAP